MSRKRLVSEILVLAEPHFRDSGYNKHLDPSKGMFGPKRPLRLYAPTNPVEFEDGFVLTSMWAITEDGIMTDAEGGGAVLEGFDCFPMEDLRMLKRWLQKEF